MEPVINQRYSLNEAGSGTQSLRRQAQREERNEALWVVREQAGDEEPRWKVASRKTGNQPKKKKKDIDKKI